MIRSARRSAWAARPRAAAAAVLVTLLTVLTGSLGASLAAAVPAVTPAASPARPSTALPAAPAGGTEGDDEAEGQDLDGELRVVLDDVDPAVAHVGEPVTLRGRVVNDSPQRRRLTTVTVRSAWAPLYSRADVTHWLEGRDQRETGWVLGQDAVGPVVVPGAEVPFTVQVPDYGLNALPGDLAALAVEIEAAGEAEPGAAAAEGPVAPPEPAVLRTVLAATRAHAVTEPLDVAWVVPLTLPADPALTSRDEQERHEAWLAATGPGSPARTWLENLTLPGVTWMVDPAMLVPVDPVDELVPAAPPPTGQTPDGTGPGEPGPADDDRSTATTRPTGQDAPTDAADQPGGSAAPTGADDAVATGRSPGEAGSDDDASTATAEPGPDDRLEEGEQLGGRPGSDAPATAAEVEDGLVALRGLLARSAAEQLWWTPAADPDVAALLAQRSSAATVRSAMNLPLPQASAQAERLLRRGRSDVAWPALASPTTDEVAALDRFWATRPATPDGAAAVILPRESISGGSNTNIGTAATAVRGTDGIVALGADTRGAALLAGADTDAARHGEGAVTQRLLADSLTAYLQDPFSQRSMLYAPPRGSQVPGGVLAALTEGFEAAPWARTVGASQLLSGADGADGVPLSGVPPAGQVLGRELVQRVVPQPAPLDARGMRGLLELDTALVGLSEVLGDTDVVRTWEPVLSQLWSTRWRGEPEAWAEARQHVRRPVVQVQEAVHVNPSTVNFLSDQGIMQVTVVNDLPVAVSGVRVELVPDGSLLRVVQQPEPISIGAESRATVSFTARAVTRGVTTVSARLTTPNGSVLGDDARVSVRVQPTGVWIYWVLGSIAGLVLVLGLVRARRTAPRSAVVAASAAGDAAAAPPIDDGDAVTSTAEENR